MYQDDLVAWILWSSIFSLIKDHMAENERKEEEDKKSYLTKVTKV